MYKVRFLAIRLQEYNQGYKGWCERPFLFHVEIDGEPEWHEERRYYHSTGPSYQPLSEGHFKTEKDYGVFTMYERMDPYDVDEGTRIDDVLIQFAKDWPPSYIKYGEEIPETPRTGFISPAGQLYPCVYGAHIGFAIWIYRAVFGMDGDEKGLLQDGWIQVNRGSVNLPDERDVTEAQKAVLRILWVDGDEGGSALSMKDIPYKTAMRYALEELGVLEAPTFPHLVKPGRKAVIPT